MKLLLCKTVDKLGIVGDVVDVAAGYGRNYLVPYGLATTPTEGNMRRLAEARRVAEEDRSRARAELEALAARMTDVEVTIRAKANEDGVLYGSVSARDIADALAEDQFFLKAEQILLDHPIRHLENMMVDVRLAQDLRTQVKVWVVRDKVDEEGAEGEESSADSAEAGTEAGGHGDSTDA